MPGNGAQRLRHALSGNRGNDQRVCLCRTLERGAAFFQRIGCDRVGLGDGEYLRFVRDAVAVGGELIAHGAVRRDRLLLSAIDEMEEDGATLEVAEEAGAKAGAFAGTFD